MKAVLRADHRTRRVSATDRVVRLSVTPSAKYSWLVVAAQSGRNGKTTIERRRGAWRSGAVAGGCGRDARTSPDRKCPHRPRDVLQRLLAQIDKFRVDPAAHMIVGRARDQTPPGSQIASRLAAILTPLPKDVVALDQHVAEADADATDDVLRPGAPALRSTIRARIATAHSMAATMERNSSRGHCRSS